MTAIITATNITSVYNVTVDGRRYKIVHNTWDMPATSWNPVRTGECWSVFSPVGTHWGAHECDPEKPTYKRVVAATKAALNGA